MILNGVISLEGGIDLALRRYIRVAVELPFNLYTQPNLCVGQPGTHFTLSLLPSAPFFLLKKKISPAHKTGTCTEP